MGDEFSREVGEVEQLVLIRVEDRLRTALHEIRQPVAAVLALAEAARGLGGATSDMRGYLDLIIEQVQEVAYAAWSVLDPGPTEDSHESSCVDVGEVLDSVVAAFSRTWSGTLTRRGHRGHVWTRGSWPVVRRCLVNVVDNAVRAAGPAGEVVVTLYCGSERVRIVVEDDGPGFGGVPRGTGIGLSVTRRELQHIQGTLSSGLPSRLGGARVAISLPRRTADIAYLDPPVSAG
jgi:signal transduction histidine kinase